MHFFKKVLQRIEKSPKTIKKYPNNDKTLALPIVMKQPSAGENSYESSWMFIT